MGKFNGGAFSKLKGKIAGIVFQQYEGIQVGKEYQPNVKNPSTAGQVENRAKFKLASQLVSVFSEILLIAAGRVSPYLRMVRGTLVRTLRAVAGFSDDTATLPITDFVSAVNSLNYNPAIPAPILAGSTPSTATLQAEVGDEVRYTIVGLDDEGNILGTRTVSFTATADPESVQLPLVSGTPDKYQITAVAMRQSEGSGNPTYLNLSDLSQLTIVYGVRQGDVLVSNIISDYLQ